MNHSLGGLCCAFCIWAHIFNFANLSYSGFLGETPLMPAASLKILSIHVLVLVSIQQVEERLRELACPLFKKIEYFIIVLLWLS